MNDSLNDSLVDRGIGLGAVTVGIAVLYFAMQLKQDPNSSVPLIRKIFGITIAVMLILYGLYSLVVG